MNAKEYAIYCHTSTNHLYGNEPYEVHLTMVHSVGMQFIHLIPKHARDVVEAALWCHDVIEDCRQTYNDVRNATNTTVADIVYALSNEKGKNRKERANQKYYTGIIETEYAAFVKICDRIANYLYSKNRNSPMKSLYEKEMPDFVKQLYCKEYDEMFVYLNHLIEL